MVVFLFTNLFRPSIARFTRLSTATPVLSIIPDPPKRPLNAYFAFSLTKRDEIVRLKPDLKNSEIVAEIVNSWRTLSPELKKNYESESAKQFSDFKISHLKWWNGLSLEQKQEFHKLKEREKKKKGDKRLKRQLRELGMPRRPLSAFNFFMSARLQLMKDKTNISQKEQFGKLANSWTNMSSEEKKPYLDMEIKDLERHATEMIAWEKRMRTEGHLDLLQRVNSKETSSAGTSARNVALKRRSLMRESVKPATNTK